MFMLEPERVVWGKTSPAITASNMKQVAQDDKLWSFYQMLDPTQRESFKYALEARKTWSKEEFLKFVTAPVPNLPPKETPYPEKIVKYTKDAESFKRWLKRQSELIDSSKGLEFQIGKAYELDSKKETRTISVPICLLRDKLECKGTSFVFHYHPGVKGPDVGHANASAGHFKPFDKAQTMIRATKDEIKSDARLNTLFRDARTVARKLG